MHPVPKILIEDKDGFSLYSGEPLTSNSTQITDIDVTFDDDSDIYANYTAEEDTMKLIEFDISATGNKNDDGEHEYLISNIRVMLVTPGEGSDSDPDDFESLCNSLWTEPISFYYYIDVNESGYPKSCQAYPKLSLVSD